MAAEIVMPRLSDSMEEGTVLRWLKQLGDQVAVGDELVEIETDKATMTYESDTAGVLLETLAAEGETLALGAVIARIGDPGEAAAAADGGGPGEPQPDARPKEVRSAPRTSARGSGRGSAGASPVARRVAAELGVDLGALTGSGPRGRIVRADVEAAAAQAPHEAPHAPATSDALESQAPGQAVPAAEPVSGAKGEVTVQELTRLQLTVGRRMSESRATVPEFAVTTTVDMDAALALRAELKRLAGDDGVVPSVNDLVVKASARALREHPRANGAWRDGRLELYSRVNVGMAVAAEDALVVPTLFDADRKTLGDIAKDSRRLAQSVRDGTITAPELAGGTFTVSNLGMLGVESFEAVINPPQAAILAVGSLGKRPAVDEDGRLVVRDLMTITLTCDHRVLYGADGARVLDSIRRSLEEPLRLAL